MSKVAQWISIKTVLNNISDLLQDHDYDELKVLDWSAQAMEKMRVHPTTQDRVSLVKIKDHSAILPEGVITINQFAYIPVHNHCDYFYHKDTKIPFDQYINILDSNHIEDLLCKDNCEVSWRPLRMTTNNFGPIVDTKQHNSFALQDCKDTIALQPGGVLRTSFRNGIVAISYQGYPVDDCGDFLVPDDATFLEALEVYVLKKNWERRANMKEQGAYQMMQHYAQRWNWLMPKVKTTFMMPDTDELELLLRMRNRWIPNQNRYSAFFGTLGDRDNIVTRGHYLRNEQLSDGIRFNL